MATRNKKKTAAGKARKKSPPRLAVVAKRKVSFSSIRKGASAKASREVSGRDAERVIGAYLLEKNAALAPLAAEVRRLVKATVPESSEGVNPWGVPVFDLQGPFCLLMAGKNHLTFGFTRGTSLSDPARLLEGAGKNLRHVKLIEAAQLADPHLRQLIHEAAALNRRVPLTSSMRMKKAN